MATLLASVLMAQTAQAKSDLVFLETNPNYNPELARETPAKSEPQELDVNTPEGADAYAASLRKMSKLQVAGEMAKETAKALAGCVGGFTPVAFNAVIDIMPEAVTPIQETAENIHRAFLERDLGEMTNYHATHRVYVPLQARAQKYLGENSMCRQSGEKSDIAEAVLDEKGKAPTPQAATSTETKQIAIPTYLVPARSESLRSFATGQ